MILAGKFRCGGWSVEKGALHESVTLFCVRFPRGLPHQPGEWFTAFCNDTNLVLWHKLAWNVCYDSLAATLAYG